MASVLARTSGELSLNGEPHGEDRNSAAWVGYGNVVAVVVIGPDLPWLRHCAGFIRSPGTSIHRQGRPDASNAGRAMPARSQGARADEWSDDSRLSARR